MRIRRTADVDFEGDKEVVVTVKIKDRDGRTWEDTDFTRSEKKAYGESVALMAEMIGDVFETDFSGRGLAAMHEGLKELQKKVKKARQS